MYDIAIIGLGPAGATLARLLSPRLNVIALDKKDPERGPKKPCGGLLAPDAQAALSRYGLTLPLSVLVDPQIFSVRTIDLAADVTRHYQRFYLNLDRHRFDNWLKTIIPPHVEVHHPAACRSISRIEGGFRIQWQEQGKEHECTARYVVGADGAASRVRKLLFPHAKTRTYLSIQQWFRDEDRKPFYSSVFDPASTDCYAWGLHKDEWFVFGGAFAPHGARQKFESLKKKLLPYGFPLQNPVKTEACLVMRPKGNQFCLGENGAFLVGEAAGLVSPSSLEGISYALNSARALSIALNSGEKPHQRYRKETVGIRAKLLGKQLKCPFMYWPPLRYLVMKSGLNSHKVAEE